MKREKEQFKIAMVTTKLVGLLTSTIVICLCYRNGNGGREKTQESQADS